MNYAIFRSEPIMTTHDLAQIGSHNQREKKAYNSNPDIRIEDSYKNLELVPLNYKYVKRFKEITKEYEKQHNEKQKTERKERQRSYTQMLNQSRNCVADELLFTASPKFFENMSNDDFIFTSWLDQELISPSKYTAEWREFIHSLGYEELPLRVIRHSAATFMLQGETNIEAVKKRFGWSKVSTVLGVYNQSNLEEDRKLLNKFEEEFRNSLGLTYAELYRISVNRFSNQKKINSFIQYMLGKPVEKISYLEDLKTCQEYLFRLFPVFKKVSNIDHLLDDEEIDTIFEGFKKVYKKIKIEPLNKNNLT